MQGDASHRLFLYSKNLEASLPDMSEINELAFVKMFLHLAKYPELAVNGILLSERSASAADEADSSSYLHFIDCIPLFHGVLSLSPMIEVALSQVITSPSSLTF